jgi:hypothetical protein
MVTICVFATFFKKKKRFDKGNCNCYGLIVPKLKREGRQDRRKPAVPRTNIIPAG